MNTTMSRFMRYILIEYVLHTLRTHSTCLVGGLSKIFTSWSHSLAPYKASFRLVDLFFTDFKNRSLSLSQKKRNKKVHAHMGFLKISNQKRIFLYMALPYLKYWKFFKSGSHFCLKVKESQFLGVISILCWYNKSRELKVGFNVAQSIKTKSSRDLLSR